MMSQCIVPSWNLKYQRQELDNQGDDRNRSSTHTDFSDAHDQSSHHQHHQQQQHVMSNFEVTELTWENGQLAMHELGGTFPPSPGKPTWGGGGADDTLESIVNQAAYCNQQIPSSLPAIQHVESFVASYGGKRVENLQPIKTSGPPPSSVGSVKKRTRSEANHIGLITNDHESASASANAAFSRENNETTMMTWSFESPRSSTRTKTTLDEDSACHGGGSENQEEERETKGETGRSYTTRKGRAAAVHNQSERRRRDRINQKMKALQKLVPNASKTDKASMLDEVIEYLKQLQAQLQMMNHAGFMPQIMMQQHLQHQMSILARMGMGIGMLEPQSITQTPQMIPSMIHPNQIPNSASIFVPPAFVVPQMASDAGASSSAAHLQDPYNTLLQQSMNLELCNRIAAIQQQQQQQQTQSQPTNNRSQQNNHIQ